MTWTEAFAQNRQPSAEETKAFISSGLWQELCDYLEGAYKVKQKTAYSGCSAQPGWNVKYQKSGKSLCTLYPMAGFFIALVVVGEKERAAAEELLPGLSEYTRNLYAGASGMMGAKWLMAEVKDADILEDVKALIRLRVQPKESA